MDTLRAKEKKNGCGEEEGRTMTRVIEVAVSTASFVAIQKMASILLPMCMKVTLSCAGVSQLHSPISSAE